MSESGIDVVRHVWCAEYEPLIVAPSADAPGYVQLEARGEAAEEFWGKCSLTMPREMAVKLGEALIACAQEQS